MGSVAELLAAVALCAAAVSLLVACWRRRAVLGLLCATLAVALALIALAGIGATSEALVGSLVASAIGTALLILGQAVERLLDSEPGNEGR